MRAAESPANKLAAGFLAAFLWAPPAFASQQQVSQAGSVAPDVDVEIYNVTGSVRVTGWDRDEVTLEGTLGEGTERVRFENDGDSVEIRVVIPRSRRRDPERQVGPSDLEVMVPRGATVQIETLAAAIVVQGVDGPVTMESSAGDVIYSGGAAEIEAGSAAGSIEIDSTAAGVAIDIEGVAGDVAVQFVSGSVSAQTLTGALRVVGGRIDEGRFESVSGGLYFEGEIGADADVGFENFNGDIELLIPDDTAATFDITTYSGRIETEFGFSGERVEPYSPEQRAEFTLGDGADADVSISTFSGVVGVRRR